MINSFVDIPDKASTAIVSSFSSTKASIIGVVVFEAEGHGRGARLSGQVRTEALQTARCVDVLEPTPAG